MLNLGQRGERALNGREWGWHSAYLDPGHHHHPLQPGVHNCKHVLVVKWPWAAGSDDVHFQLPHTLEKQFNNPGPNTYIGVVL